MTNEQLDKKLFIEVELAELLAAATEEFVVGCAYHTVGSIELVDVKTVVGVQKYDTFSVNVTADSLWAVAKDVMAAVGKRYE